MPHLLANDCAIVYEYITQGGACQGLRQGRHLKQTLRVCAESIKNPKHRQLPKDQLWCRLSRNPKGLGPDTSYACRRYEGIRLWEVKVDQIPEV